MHEDAIIENIIIEDAIIEDASKLEMTTIETTRSWVQSLLSAMAYVYDKSESHHICPMS